MNGDLKDLFLCYNKADKDWTYRLGERIEAESIEIAVTGRELDLVL